MQLQQCQVLCCNVVSSAMFSVVILIQPSEAVWRDKWCLVEQLITSNSLQLQFARASHTCNPGLTLCRHATHTPAKTLVKPQAHASQTQSKPWSKPHNAAPNTPIAPRSHQVNLRKLDATTVGISIDETTKLGDIDLLLAVLNGGAAPAFSAASLAPGVAPAIAPGSKFARTSAFMTQVRPWGVAQGVG